MRGASLCVVLALASAGLVGCAKNNCHRLAELTCRTEGTSDEDCRTARAAARRANTEAEITACGAMYKTYAPESETK
jgi:hypothetical protein